MKGRIVALAVILVAAPLVAVEEGVILNRYADPIGIPTACAGETDREIVSFKAKFTRDECIAVMGASLYKHALEVDKCIKVPLERHEAVAVLSWSYNVGTGAACGSTLMRLLNAGQPASVWCAQLSRWDKAGGRTLRGLTNRRAKERAICEGQA